MLLKIALFALTVGLVLLFKVFIDKKKTGKMSTKSNMKLVLITVLISFIMLVIFSDGETEKVDYYELVEMKITVLEKKEGIEINTGGIRTTRQILRPLYKVETVEQGEMVVSAKENFEEMVEGETYIVGYYLYYGEIAYIRDSDSGELL